MSLIPQSGANAVKIILKNKEAFKCYLKNKEVVNGITTITFDVFYEDHNGTFTMRIQESNVITAALNLVGLKKVITLDNDANLPKLCKYTLETYNK